jgi:hypothetical protein
MTHIHDRDACLVQFVDDILRRDTDGTDKELDLLLDDDIDELRQLSLRVVILQGGWVTS